MSKTLQLSDKVNLTIADVIDIAEGKATLVLSDNTAWSALIDKTSDVVSQLHKNHRKIYGITTGFGDSVDVEVPSEKMVELQYNLARFHGCGLGKFFDQLTARAIMVCRLASLKSGYSGIRLSILQRIKDLIDKDIIPVIPEEGSVGASGDLTPLSYIAAVLYGERNVFYKGEIRSAESVYKELGIDPVIPGPKETLCIMNGTSVMTAIACFAFKRAHYLCSLASRITALASLALKADSGHFDDRIFAAKPFAGQRKAAQIIREDYGDVNHSYRIQAPYSIRCAPHAIGVLADSLPWIKEFIETELNSTNDNPLIDPETGDFLHSGNFYGGHIAFAMDSLKTAVANIADLLDRQFALLANYKTNNNLPKNLTGADDKSINHGFKAVQIAVSAWTAEALQKTMPLTSFSRSTECHNQDKVSMGTIAARDCIRVIELVEQVCAASLFAFAQGVELRVKLNEIDEQSLPAQTRRLKEQILETAGFLSQDRPVDRSLKNIIQEIAFQKYEVKPFV